MYVTDVPVSDQLTDRELRERENLRGHLTDQGLSVHMWAVAHTGRTAL